MRPVPATSSATGLQERFWRWFDDLPLITSWVVSASFVGFLADFLLMGQYSYLLNNCPVQVLHRFQLWRPITALFVQTDILNFAIGVFVFYKYAAMIEHSGLGSLQFAYLLFMLALLTHTLFTIVVGLMATQEPFFFMLCAGGLMSVWMPLIVLKCKTSQVENTSCCGWFDVPTKVYPVFLVVVLAIIFGYSVLVHVCGWAVGYAYVEGYLDSLFPAPGRFMVWEALPRLDRVSQRAGFVTCTGNSMKARSSGWFGHPSTGVYMSAPAGAATNAPGPVSMSVPASASGSSGSVPGTFVSFAGAGHTLGHDPSPTAGTIASKRNDDSV